MATKKRAEKRPPKTADKPTWPLQIHKILKKADVCQVAYVPDAGHAQLIVACQKDRGMTCVPLTTEEEGVALLAGAWLGGQRGVLLMQSSGMGNCINMLSLVQECRFPLLMLITMRGEWGEFNPWQVPMGQRTADILKAAGTIVQRVDHAGEIADTVTAAQKLAFDTERAVAVLIGQRVVGTKVFK